MNTRRLLSILVLSTTVLASAAIPTGAQPPPGAVRGPAHGDGGVSDFYAWKEKVPRLPGRLLRQEPLPDQLMLTNAAKGFRVLYTSTDGIDGKSSIAVSGAIYLPRGTPSPAGWPIVAWAHGTTGTADVCAPSWMERGTRDTDYLNAWLGQGYAVVASDYQGLGTPGGHPWMAVRPEGWSVLDSVRSALRAFPELANAVVIVGQSQGSHAALSATGLAPRYAPALRIKGTVATGVAGPLYAASRRTTALLFLLLHKFQAMDPAFRPSDYLTEEGERGYAAAASTCVRPGPVVPLDPLLKAWPDHAKIPAVEDWPTLHFTHPVFIGTATHEVMANGARSFRLQVRDQVRNVPGRIVLEQRRVALSTARGSVVFHRWHGERGRPSQAPGRKHRLAQGQEVILFRDAVEVGAMAFRAPLVEIALAGG